MPFGGTLQKLPWLLVPAPCLWWASADSDARFIWKSGRAWNTLSSSLSIPCYTIQKHLLFYAFFSFCCFSFGVFSSGLRWPIWNQTQSYCYPRPSLLTFAPKFRAHGLHHCKYAENWGPLQSFSSFPALFSLLCLIDHSATPTPKGLLNCFFLFLILYSTTVAWTFFFSFWSSWKAPVTVNFMSNLYWDKECPR